jgi:hypothetical protein
MAQISLNSLILLLVLQGCVSNKLVALPSELARQQSIADNLPAPIYSNRCFISTKNGDHPQSDDVRDAVCSVFSDRFRYSFINSRVGSLYFTADVKLDRVNSVSLSELIYFKKQLQIYFDDNRIIGVLGGAENDKVARHSTLDNAVAVNLFDEIKKLGIPESKVSFSLNMSLNNLLR